MLDFDVSLDVREVERMFKHMPRVVEKATVRTLNRTIDSVATIVRRLIAKDMGIPQKRVRIGMFKIKAVRHKLVASIGSTDRPINLIRFKARQTKKGVSASAWGKRRVYKGTFIGNKGRTVFKREEEGRLPIRGVWGPAIPKTMLQDYIIKAMRIQAGSAWRKNFPRNLQFYIDRETRGGSFF